LLPVKCTPSDVEMPTLQAEFSPNENGALLAMIHSYRIQSI
jgi:hypothetical protein